jgi:hypothetical protein
MKYYFIPLLISIIHFILMCLFLKNLPSFVDWVEETRFWKSQRREWLLWNEIKRQVPKNEIEKLFFFVGVTYLIVWFTCFLTQSFFPDFLLPEVLLRQYRHGIGAGLGLFWTSLSYMCHYSRKKAYLKKKKEETKK